MIRCVYHHISVVKTIWLIDLFFQIRQLIRLILPFIYEQCRSFGSSYGHILVQEGKDCRQVMRLRIM